MRKAIATLRTHNITLTPTLAVTQVTLERDDYRPRLPRAHATHPRTALSGRAKKPSGRDVDVVAGAELWRAMHLPQLVVARYLLAPRASSQPHGRHQSRHRVGPPSCCELEAQCGRLYSGG
jgi:hypothetical protein